MCGINGILRLDDAAPPVDSDELRTTRDAMTSRGPDGEGLWVAAGGDIGLGHRRLAIIDLSDAGLQPMSRAEGRYRITFNGEIYNYRELREELARDGAPFHTESDTEVILALYEREGPAMLDRLRGMYALALWDAGERRLLLARDPYGIKPLYYSERAGFLRFASQVKALEAGGAIPQDVDSGGLVGFLLWGSVPEPHTIRSAVRALPAGHHLVVQHGTVGRPLAHYRFEDPPSAGGDDPVTAVRDSVRAHLVADVPVGIFLSAGMDSALIAANAARLQAEPPTTLTLTFDEYAGTPMDEGPLAAEVARELGTRHVEHRVKRDDFLDVWSQATAVMDQPSIDGFNTYVISRYAREAGFKVVLSGLGGDELFGGYPSFQEVGRWMRATRVMRRVPGLRTLWPALAALRPHQPKLGGMLEHAGSIPGAYFVRRGLFLPQDLPRLLGPELAREGLAAYDAVADADKFLGLRDRPGAHDVDGWGAVHVMESTQYMRNQLLRDVDWASMAHSLELRVPLVDARLRDSFAGGGFEPARRGGKAALVRRAVPELPAALWGRPKSGFSIPVMEWLDDEIRIDSARGLASRSLALRVLEAFDLPLAGARLDVGSSLP